MRTTQDHGTAKQNAYHGEEAAARQCDGFRTGKLFYTIKEVVATGLCSRQTLWRLMKSGELGYVKVGTRVLIPREELLGFVRSHYHKGSSLDRGTNSILPTPRWHHPGTGLGREQAPLALPPAALPSGRHRGGEGHPLTTREGNTMNETTTTANAREDVQTLGTVDATRTSREYELKHVSFLGNQRHRGHPGGLTATRIQGHDRSACKATLQSALENLMHGRTSIVVAQGNWQKGFVPFCQFRA